MHQSGEQRLAGLCQITEHLFLSNGRAANDKAVISRFNITCIINATQNITNTSTAEVEYVHIPVTDSPSSPLSDFFDEVADKIQLVGEQCGRTLVHCNAGVSRSATLCLVYLMKYHGITLLEAHKKVKSCRPIIRPNSGFWKQLIQYERKLRGCATVTMITSPMGEVPDIYEEETKDMLPL
ncbi:dual specificity protein phosphatase 18 [Oncorhynchus keta]|uniref:dual specificity protein phosphatase 18 n=1 Tax=Oncorhynchus keta TaxID=8018 RepID=UPI0015FBC98B|nr:dual specificity protein phosphatase 18 [Oncorhynchus keta]XP_035641581.1 dual specificity protein phosphatase 18 [Oncorhynchus keta]XP_035641582.1 dual specificity protein phosphatase 18 [Oncorhynchus keta]XP_052317448.1 dual specificity protein phosphatase 18 [Oncorhynchus keta]